MTVPAYLVLAASLTACAEGGDAARRARGSVGADPPGDQAFFSDYMGQNPPGLQPVVFAPGVISTERTEIAFEMSPDGSEIYFVRILQNIPRILFTRRTDNGWSTPEPAPSIGDHYGNHPSFSPDGTALYFSSNRELPADWPGNRPAQDSRERIKVWRAVREGTGWGEPRPVFIPNGGRILDPAATEGGTIYSSGIFRAVFTNGRYGEPERLMPDLEGQWPYVAPDESFIVFGHGFPRHLLVSFRNPDGTWTVPRSVSDGFGFEGAEMNGMPFVTPDRKYLFFTANHDIYWVDARVLDQ